jgi:hypothetical protein
MAGIVQKAMNASSSTDDGNFLSDRDKELLFEEIKSIDKEIPRLAN